MKHIVITLIMFALSMPRLHAQTFAATLPAMHNEVIPATASINLAAPGTGNKRAKSAMITGFGCMGAGSLMFVGGFALVISANNETTYNNSGRAGVGVLVAGAILFVSGTALAITGGVIYHRSKKHGYTIISPKKNQLGLAYNF